MPLLDSNNEQLTNTRSMSLAPQPAKPFDALDECEEGRTFQFLPVFDGAVFTEQVQYPIIVEMWDKKKHGRARRAWEETFTQAERDKIASYHSRFYRWHLVSGAPLRVSCRLNTLLLLQRAVAFFASL